MSLCTKFILIIKNKPQIYNNSQKCSKRGSKASVCYGLWPWIWHGSQILVVGACVCMCTERQNAEKPISLRRRAFASAPLKANTCKFSAKLLCNKRRRVRACASFCELHAGPGFVVRARAIYEKYGGNKPALNAKHFFVSRSITFKQQH